jgi:hypothetical protein
MTGSGSRIAWPLRAWIAVEIGFGVSAMLTIALHPAESATNFAWPIKPEVTAALLGAFYMSSAWIFVLAVFAKRWEMIRVMVIPVILFTGAELLATFLHWDRFALWTARFDVWFASYLLPPPVFAACYLWQQRAAASRSASRTDQSRPLHRAVRALLVAIGAGLVIGGAVAFIWPQVLIAAAPWKLTPLTTRATCGWLIVLGAMMLSAAMENDRDRARIVSPFFVLLLPAVAWQVSRYSAQVNWSHPSVPIAAAALAIICGIGLYLGRGSWRDTLGA